jgi:arsenate reductase (thioredoxin)
MKPNSTIIFVCEHGAAKSVLAAAYFNKLAAEMGLQLRAIARGTNPDAELSSQTVKGLLEDGLHPPESAPKKLTEEDVESAQCVIAFCELPIEYEQKSMVEHWEEVPPVSENYVKARDAIIERVRRLLNE